MDVSLFQAAAAMNASSRWQEIISDNLSASQVTGFKKQDTSFSAVQAGFMPRSPGAPAASPQHFVMPLAGTTTNFQSGELRPTGITTDFAIEGPGFFEVQLSDGTSGYTRNGEFRVTSQGQLLTKQGLQVMSENGPIQLDPNSRIPLSISSDGEIAQGQNKKGKLRVVDFPDRSVMTQTASGVFLVNDPNVVPEIPKDSEVRQGFVENANVSTMLEMGNLITAMRYYEANQKIVQAEDDRTARLISEVANPS